MFWAIVGLVVGALSLMLALVVSLSARRREQELSSTLSETRLAAEWTTDEASAVQSGLAAFSGPRVPAPPEPLVKACSTGRCVLFAGTGLAVELGQPTWREALLSVLRLCEQRYPDPLWRTLAGTIGERHDVAIDLLVARLGRSVVQELLHEVVTERAPLSGVRAHRSLRSIPFAGVISNAWDDLAIELFEDREPVVLDAQSSEQFAETLRDGTFFILRAFGAFADGSLLLTSEDFRTQLEDHPGHARFLRSLYATRTVLFVGTGVTGIEEFLSDLRLRTPSERRHFALVPWSMEAELHRDRLEQRYNVELLIYQPTPGHPQVREFTHALARKVAPDVRPARTGQAPTLAALTSVSLRDIGPFERLDLTFDAGWSILLGDNGCGKSTVLRAIALALCGNDDRAAAAAGRLLRAGTDLGSIELCFGDDTFRTTLVRDRTRILVQPAQITPVQAGVLLALGFPPLRGASVRSPKPPAGAGAPDPGVEDLLPLVTGVVDERLDDVKQWIVNRLYADAAEGANPARSAFMRARSGSPPRAVARLFSVLGALAQPGVGFAPEFSGVDPETLEVLVGTPDGVVPLHQLSQGMDSVLSWVGTLVARLEDARGAGPAGSAPTPLVLVDELDAHLHPRWQREIVAAIQRELGEIQVVATTHSPLIVGSVDDTLLWRLHRTAGGIQAETVGRDYRGWRADQILTGPPFDTDARDPRTTELLETYSELTGREDLDEEQQRRLAKAARELDLTLPSTAERAEAQLARELIEHAAAERIRAIPEDQREEVMRELRLQVQEAFTRGSELE